MKHIPFILVFLAIITIVSGFTWKRWAHSRNDQFFAEPIEPGLELIADKQGFLIKETGILIGKKLIVGLKQLTNEEKVMVEILNIEKLLTKSKDKSINRGWIIEKKGRRNILVSKIYWVATQEVIYYFYPEKKYKLKEKSIITNPCFLNSRDYKSNNQIWIAFIILIEVLFLYLAFRWVMKKIIPEW